MDSLWPWLLLGLLGAYHGLNPAMGWLFAVALGMQERSRRAVVRSLLPIAIGHECSIALVAVLVVILGVVADTQALHLGAGVALIAFGIFRFVKPRAHFRWVRGTVNRRELAWWSFLMSTAHGAGLMVAPVLIGAGAATDASASSNHALAMAESGGMGIPGSAVAITLHVAAMLAVMGVVAVVVSVSVSLAATGSAGPVPRTRAITVCSPASVQLTPRTRVTVWPGASVPSSQVTRVTGNGDRVQPAGRTIAAHDSSMSSSSRTPVAASGPALPTTTV